MVHASLHPISRKLELVNTAPRKRAEVGLFREVWKETNRLLDYIREISPTTGRGVRVSRTLNNTLFTADIPRVEPGEPGVVKQFIVRTIEADYLGCEEWDGTNATGSAVFVAKPFNLRKNPWNGLTQNYTIEPYPSSPGSLQVIYSFPSASVHTYRIASVVVGNVSTAEHQVVIPRWIPNVSVIFASASENGTGVGVAAEWQDLNADGRAWAKAV